MEYLPHLSDAATVFGFLLILLNMVQPQFNKTLSAGIIAIGAMNTVLYLAEDVANLGRPYVVPPLLLAICWMFISLIELGRYNKFKK